MIAVYDKQNNRSTEIQIHTLWKGIINRIITVEKFRYVIEQNLENLLVRPLNSTHTGLN